MSQFARRDSNSNPSPSDMSSHTYNNPAYIASCSFGKDSIATTLLALEHGEPLDAAVFSEVMFDHRRGISGEMPEHIEWIYSTAIPRLAALGVRVDVVRSEKDYLTLFHTIIRSGAHQGMLCGWLIGGKCYANRDLKIQPIHRYYGRFRERGVVQYVDEPRRLARMQDKGYIRNESTRQVRVHRGGCPTQVRRIRSAVASLSNLASGRLLVLPQLPHSDLRRPALPPS